MPASSARPIRVLIVDDSAAVRQALVAVLTGEPGIEVMAAASDPFAAARAMQAEMPDVVILDIEMPRMDGLTFLRKIMAQKPLSVIVCSTLVQEGSDVLARALDAGAVDVITKPRIDTKQFLMEARVRVCDAVRAAAKVDLSKLRAARARPRLVEKKLSADAMLPPPSRRPGPQIATDRIICIGASTGGTEALLDVIEKLPADGPGVVVVQHMPEGFTAAFAARLDRTCLVRVREARDGDLVQPGLVLIAPGNFHLLLDRRGTQYRVVVKDGPLVSRHRPSVDVLFRSAAQKAGSNAVGVLLTGMGDDGAKGLLEMREAGALTLAQDEASCVVFGMPKAAIALGAAVSTASLDTIGDALARIKMETA